MRLDEIEIVEDTNPKVLHVLSALFVGSEVKINGCRYKLAKTTTDSVQIVQILDSDEGEVVLGIDHTITSFVKLCNDLSEDELFLISCKTAMIKDNLKKRNERLNNENIRKSS